jgi:hypothetical protein
MRPSRLLVGASLLAGCSNATGLGGQNASPIDSVTFAATTTVSGGQIRPSVSFTNTSAKPVPVEFGGCVVSLLVFRTADRSGTPAWDSNRRRGPNGLTNVCLTYLVMTTLAPGQTGSPKEYNPTFAVADMLGDSLPEAHYYFKVRASLSSRAVELVAGDADVKR